MKNGSKLIRVTTNLPEKLPYSPRHNSRSNSFRKTDTFLYRPFPRLINFHLQSLLDERSFVNTVPRKFDRYAYY